MGGIILFFLGLFAVGTWLQDGRNGTDYEDSDDFNSTSRHHYHYHHHHRHSEEDPDEGGEEVMMGSCQEENGQGGIFSPSNSFSCCGSEKFKAGLDLEKHYEDCSTAPPHQSPFHMNYWRMYECLASRSLADGQPLNAYNYAQMMTLNLSSAKRSDILDLVNEFENEMDQNSTTADRNVTQDDSPFSTMEIIMEMYLLAKYRVCNVAESFNDTQNVTMTEEVVGGSILNCRNHSYPNIPLFPVSTEKVQECLEDKAHSKIFNSLHIDDREVLCAHQSVGSSTMTMDNHDNVTDIAPQFYSASVLSAIDRAANSEDSPPNVGAATLNEELSEEDREALAELQGVVDAYLRFKNGVQAYCSGNDGTADYWQVE